VIYKRSSGKVLQAITSGSLFWKKNEQQSDADKASSWLPQNYQKKKSTKKSS